MVCEGSGIVKSKEEKSNRARRTVVFHCIKQLLVEKMIIKIRN